MTIENARALIYNSRKNSELEEQALKLKGLDPEAAIDALVSLGHEHSLHFTREELLAVLKDLNAADGRELNEEELEAVSGGLQNESLTTDVAAASRDLMALGRTIAGSLTFMR